MSMMPGKSEVSPGAGQNGDAAELPDWLTALKPADELPPLEEPTAPTAATRSPLPRPEAAPAVQPRQESPSLLAEDDLPDWLKAFGASSQALGAEAPTAPATERSTSSMPSWAQVDTSPSAVETTVNTDEVPPVWLPRASKNEATNDRAALFASLSSVTVTEAPTLDGASGLSTKEAPSGRAVPWWWYAVAALVVLVVVAAVLLVLPR